MLPRLLLSALVMTTTASADDFTAELEQVTALSELTTAPKTYPAEEFDEANGITPMFFDGLDYQGKPTRVFARLGFPEKTDKKFPGVVLVHGGGGSAFSDWIVQWNARGYAAISIAVEGQTDRKNSETKKWKRHPHGGPARDGIYGDSDQPFTDQWMYHAVADTVLANSLFRSLPEVDAEKVGIMGISWGGIITSTVIGIDQRYAFAIPTYGCGDLADAPNQYGRALGNNQLYRQVWDPMVRLKNASMPTLWFSWTGDQHFPLNHQANSYGQVSGKHMVSLIPKMRHGHAPGWNPEDSYAFADSILNEGRPWCFQSGIKTEGSSTRVRFDSTKEIESAILTSTTNLKKWSNSPATISKNGDATVITATIPNSATHWFVLLKSGNLHACSDLQTSSP